MAATQVEIESQVTELSAAAFAAFCEDVSGMFGIDMKSSQQEAATTAIDELGKSFKDLTAVCLVKAEGVLDGTFKFIFDKEGLFTLGGVIIMWPA